MLNPFKPLELIKAEVFTSLPTQFRNRSRTAWSDPNRQGAEVECFLEGRPIREEYLIVQGGHLAGAGAHSYSEGDTTDGAEEAAEFKAGMPPIPA